MQKAVPKELNFLNLLEITKAISGIDHFIFFGTLLGIIRDDDIIPHDDDIDIYVDIDLKKDLILALEGKGFNVDETKYPNLTEFFLQLKIQRGSIQTYVDFYFYDSSDQNFIVEKWNFKGDVENNYENIHIPKNLIFPLQRYSFKKIELTIPAKPKEVCAFLYGNKWNIPLKKETQYFTAMILNRPFIFYGRIGFFLVKKIRKFQYFKLKFRNFILK